MNADKIREVGIRNLALQLLAVFAILLPGYGVSDRLLSWGGRWFF
jgi:hypothetical protein